MNRTANIWVGLVAAVFAWDPPAPGPLAQWEEPVAQVLKLGPVPGLPTNVVIASGSETQAVVELRRRQYVTLSTIYADGQESAATEPLLVDTPGRVYLEESTNLVDWAGVACITQETNGARHYRIRIER